MTVTQNESTPRSCSIPTSYWTHDSCTPISPILPSTPAKACSRKLTYTSPDDEITNKGKRQRTSGIPISCSSDWRSKSCERVGNCRVNTKRASTGCLDNNNVVVTPSLTPRTPLSILNNPTSATACKIRQLRKKRVIRSKSSDNIAQCLVSLTPLTSKVPADKLCGEKKRPKKNLRKKIRESVMKPDTEGTSLNGHSFVDWFKKRQNN